MRRTVASSLLSLLLLTTLMWGGCISCEQFFMLPGVKTCCAPSGHCKTKTSVPQNAGSECQQMAFDHQKSADLHVDLPVVADVLFVMPVRSFVPLTAWHGIESVEPSPPDLQVLHSTFLI